MNMCLMFQKKSLLKIQQITMTIEERIRDEKVKYGFNREAAKMSALSSDKMDKYEYTTGEEVVPHRLLFKHFCLQLYFPKDSFSSLFA